MPAGFINLVESLSMTAPEHVQGIFWWTAGVYHQLYSLIMMHTRLLKVYAIAAFLAQIKFQNIVPVFLQHIKISVISVH